MSASAPAPRAQRGILACAGGTLAPRAPPAPSRRVHRARARARVHLEGLSVPHTARHGAARPPRGRSTCAPGREEGLYVVQRPTRSRPACSARAWWACSGAPLGPRVVSSGPLGSSRCCGCRGPPACLGGSPECVGHLCRVSGGLERDIRILEAATEPPVAGFGAWRGVRRSGPHSEVRDILISILGHSGPSLRRIRSQSCIDRSSSRGPLVVRPRGGQPATVRGALRPNRGHGGHVRSSPTKKACNGQPRSWRQPGGRVAA